ncbi:Adenine nucleotide alpha hydrolases-like superfamily protein [Hibiscus syriacus]|uniref:Adenine nucleotide alpha hydrolases-like superfamily protein n=1 Tax=Hibiscus syriacus TaxID=106335 RepID=A0A6A3BBB9_HIBSY|nr:uncharacterized protein LOC120218380 [Hibiscus syriacus]KAE8714224.1 Adenine nucleotide alpha hydrolases-like superfamily protein [Hibiscus syriacus]
MVLVLLFCCIILFNPVICVRQQPPASAPTTASAPVPTPIPQPSIAASNPQIRTLCAKTFYPRLCIRSIEPFFNGKTDPQSVAVMLIKAMSERSKRAIKTATKMAADPLYSDDPMLVSEFNGCRQQYDDALVALKEAMDAILVREIETVETKVSQAQDDYEICDNGFTRHPDNTITDGVSPMAKINEKLTNIGDVITDIILSLT